MAEFVNDEPTVTAATATSASKNRFIPVSFAKPGVRFFQSLLDWLAED